MTNWKWMAVLALALPALPVPAAAQNAAQDGVLVIYGNDVCPTDANGNEIVVCARRPESDRYRIPKELRELRQRPENTSWAVRQRQTRNVGRTGIGSCSAVGPGGGIGCLSQTIEQGTSEARAREAGEDTGN